MSLQNVVRPATVEDARDIASRIRPEDRREGIALVGISPSILLPMAARERPDSTFVGVGPSGRPEAIFGTSPVVGAPGMGMVWLMATKTLSTDRKTQIVFIRNSEEALDQLHKEYPILGNYVDERNALHINWLRHTGFTLIKRIPEFGAERRPFLQVIRTKE